MNSPRIKSVLNLVGFAAFIISMLVILLNIRSISFAVIDWWAIRNYQPDSAITLMVEQTSMTEAGRKVFYAGQPILLNKTDFNSNCPINETTFVLGCYSHRNIFLLDVEDPQLEPVEPVTAAHEMLHGVWERHSAAKQEELGQQLIAFFEAYNDERLNKLVENYRNNTEDEEKVIPNELHSILATEVLDLPKELEDYYQQYFNDRSKVVALFESYESVFAQLQAQRDQLEIEIAALKVQIEQYEAQLVVKKAEIDAINAELNELQQANKTSEFNAKVPAQNKAAKEFNNLVATYNATIIEHNQKVKLLNSLAAQQNDLIKSIDSKFQ